MTCCLKFSIHKAQNPIPYIAAVMLMQKEPKSVNIGILSTKLGTNQKKNHNKQCGRQRLYWVALDVYFMNITEIGGMGCVLMKIFQ